MLLPFRLKVDLIRSLPLLKRPPWRLAQFYRICRGSCGACVNIVSVLSVA